MERFVNMILESGERGLFLSLNIILPIMVTLMAVMKVMDEKNVLPKISELLSPLFIKFGIPGLGVFALVQSIFISSTAPLATLLIMEEKKFGNAKIAATLAAIFVLPQANASFPLIAVGLNYPVNIATGFLGALLAGIIAYRLYMYIHPDENQMSSTYAWEMNKKGKQGVIHLMFKGGEEGLRVSLKTIPPLILAILLVTVLEETGFISFVAYILNPHLSRVGVPESSIFPIIMKFIAGGTASMALILDLMEKEMMTVAELNRIAGFVMNPLSPVGVFVLVSAGEKTAKVARIAVIAAIIGVMVRGAVHLLIFCNRQVLLEKFWQIIFPIFFPIFLPDSIKIKTLDVLNDNFLL